MTEKAARKRSNLIDAAAPRLFIKIGAYLDLPIALEKSAKGREFGGTHSALNKIEFQGSHIVEIKTCPGTTLSAGAARIVRLRNRKFRAQSLIKVGQGTEQIFFEQGGLSQTGWVYRSRL